MEAKDLLAQYVTNTDGQVFAIQNLHGIVGAVMARYSRAETGLRETLLREFIVEDKLKLNKAASLIERVLIAYGDDSVGELEGAHLSFEQISLLATKTIEHRRIGGSPIEQSTRYIRYDFKDSETGYQYNVPDALPESLLETYRGAMDRIFDGYASMWGPLYDYLVRQKPIETAMYDIGAHGSRLQDMPDAKAEAAFHRTWQMDIKTKACDILRAFLPLATRANVGLFGNGRFFQHLISKMLSSPLPEVQRLGNEAFHELSKVIPHYVKRARRLDYLVANHGQMQALAKKYFSDLAAADRCVTYLIEPDTDFIFQLQTQWGGGPHGLGQALRQEQSLGMLASIVFPYVRGSFVQLRDRIRMLPVEVITELFDAYYGQRQTRRDRPERGLEFGYPYHFDLVTEWAVYKDLMRHRMGTIQIQALVPDLGFVFPDELDAAGLGDVARETVAHAEHLFQQLETHCPALREYAVLQGHRVRWFLGMNDRALMHMLELRTAPQGHPNYRICCQELHDLVMGAYPDRAARMNFVNREQIYWSRSESEARQRVKEAQLGNDLGDS